MAVEIFDVDGKNIEETGTPGELVCTRPHPSMPVRFWGDNNDEKYRKAYFDTYPGTSWDEKYNGHDAHGQLTRRMAACGLHREEPEHKRFHHPRTKV